MLPLLVGLDLNRNMGTKTQMSMEWARILLYQTDLREFNNSLLKKVLSQVFKRIQFRILLITNLSSQPALRKSLESSRAKRVTGLKFSHRQTRQILLLMTELSKKLRKRQEMPITQILGQGRRKLRSKFLQDQMVKCTKWERMEHSRKRKKTSRLLRII